MKSFVILAAAAFLTVNAVAAMPTSPAKADGTSAQPVLFMAEQELPFEVHTASQQSAAPTLRVGAGPNGRRLAPRRPRARPRTAAAAEPWLPGFENG